MIYKLGENIPKVGKDNYIAPTASLIGKVETGDEVSVWFNAVLRGDNGEIKIGDRTNIQDNVVIHSNEGGKVVVGKDVTLGHGCTIHGCEIGDNTLVGMNALITDHVKIPKNCFIYAGSMVTSRIGEIEEGSFIKGNPAKCIGKISEKQEKSIKSSSKEYRISREKYLQELIK
ncbi:gamma carbonic anhydrase family protein [Fusobacterium sp. MFO224]|uniref:gamma carbonic anhydrase family protein n=1 Tax=Fusobacterium sp. MFO224 TaxID=3378070 RepID=UPI0038532D85